VATATPGPLDHLPRPLSERGRSPARRRQRIGAVLLAGLIAAIGVAVATSLSNGPLTSVGAVQGAVGSTPTPDAHPGAAAFAAAATPHTTRVPVATPTPAPSAPPPETLTGYRWPLPHGRLTLPFGPTPWGSRIVDGELFHDGVDFATFCGDRIAAAHGGTVLAAGRRYDRYMGWVGDLQPYLDRLEKKRLWSTLPIIVVIDDGNGYRSIYAHFGKVVVKKGQTVKAGQLLGYEGRTGRASGCHLHYGLFSPAETATFGIDPKVVKRMKVPALQIARIDPMLVLGPRPKAPKPSASPTP
jgi:murein DD-endopeptidase MepM/ murein hydrolase activator NlpD